MSAQQQTDTVSFIMSRTLYKLTCGLDGKITCRIGIRIYIRFLVCQNCRHEPNSRAANEVNAVVCNFQFNLQCCVERNTIYFIKIIKLI